MKRFGVPFKMKPSLWALSFALLSSFVGFTHASTTNDNFANALVIAGYNGMAGTLTDNNFNTANGPESGEPGFVSTYGEFPTTIGRSVWYNWTAPTNGTAVFETIKSDFDTRLSIFTGSGVGSLNLVAGNDNA